MNKLDEAINRIKNLECPTGDVENRVAGILENYGLGDKSTINIVREKSLDTDDAQAYQVKLEGKKSIVLLAESGYDDYVAKVVDAYRNP